MLPPKYVGEAISSRFYCPIFKGTSKNSSNRESTESFPSFVTKFLLVGGAKRREQAPALRCTDIFLCIYCEFRICLTNASGYAHTPILTSPLRTTPIIRGFLFNIKPNLVGTGVLDCPSIHVFTTTRGTPRTFDVNYSLFINKATSIFITFIYSRSPLPPHILH